MRRSKVVGGWFWRSLKKWNLELRNKKKEWEDGRSEVKLDGWMNEWAKEWVSELLMKKMMMDILMSIWMDEWMEERKKEKKERKGGGGG